MDTIGSARRFSFSSSWLLDAPPHRVRDVLVDLEHFPVWWPQVRAVASLGADDARVLIRSVLPYTLDLVLHAEARELPVLRVAIEGDLRGWAQWTLHPEGTGTAMRFAQDVELRALPAVVAALGRPVLRWNHTRMMAGCRSGLENRLRSAAQAGSGARPSGWPPRDPPRAPPRG